MKHCLLPAFFSSARKKNTTHAIILHDNFVIREVLEEFAMRLVSGSSQFAELFQSFSDDVIWMRLLTPYAYTLCSEF